MTVLSRGARARRGGRRPGWLLLTGLLFTAIAASAVLVFTTRVELLKLAVVLALWAAVVAAFASVLYRRQSDVDQARARDLKLVYDLQLDREISARREYELTVESQLRRELASELRSHAADEVAALRAELSALRTNLEVLFDADLDHHPALETERTTVRAYSDWGRDVAGASTSQVPSSRVTETGSENAASQTDQNPIIDVPEVGVDAHEWQEWEASQARPGTGGHGAHRSDDAYGVADGQAWTHPGAHRRWPSNAGQSPDGAGWWPGQRYGAPTGPKSPEPTPPAAAWNAAPQEKPVTGETGREWQPVGAEGEWLPPGAPGSNWTPSEQLATDAATNETTQLIPVATDPDGDASASPHDTTPHDTTPEVSPVTGRRGRHAEPAASAPTEEHGGEPTPGVAPSPARHRSLDSAADADAPSGGQTVADLLARLQANQSGGGRRRRREE